MKKYKTRYEIIDDFGEVVRVVYDKPTSDYKYKVVKVLIFDTDLLEDALM